ncbi:MAG: hypothetical protein CBC42_07855 [Betaproteobacteria bacterium TMED82]|nr:MAG: hypothetical protein CBC42_07855 [Betaproteobacteria bacterium TMED82]|tara:strand:+ start:10958 stop:11518 length:561 start_codon:yes stop_codon:yes gene_type:complete
MTCCTIHRFLTLLFLSNIIFPVLSKDNEQLTISTLNNIHHVTIRKVFSAERCTVWNAITDYNKLSKFYENLQDSTVITDINNKKLIKQVFVGEALGLKVKQSSTLSVIEEPYKTIKIFQVSGDFSFYSATWELFETKNVHLILNVEFKLPFLKNLFLTREALEHNYKVFSENLTYQVNHYENNEKC